MSRAEDYLQALNATTHEELPNQGTLTALLYAIADAWMQADAGIPSEAEAQRWSKVCNAAEQVVGI